MHTMNWKIQFITPEIYNKCLKNIDVEKIELLRIFSFGEPLLHPRLAEILKQISKQRWKVKDVESSTSGQFYNKEKLKAAFKTGVLTKFFISCDGDGTPEEYERLRPPSKWHKLIKFMKAVKKLRDKYSPNLHLGARVICPKKENRKRWKGILKKYGFIPIFRYYKNLPGMPKISNKNRPASSGLCDFVSTKRGRKLYVDADGSVVPCCHHPRAFVAGNLQKQTYREIIKSQHYKNILNQMKNDRNAMKICGTCETK